MLATFLRFRGASRLAAALCLSAAGCLAPATRGAAAETGILHLSCANVASGASWAIAVDLDHSRVDATPATITAKWISWPDPKQGIYELERATGKLQFRNASSTGGYFLYYTCRQE